MEKEGQIQELQVKEELDIEDPINNELVGGDDDGGGDDDEEPCW
eukprot:CAMPEP_0167824018 /NCGR_PEP_ID=MMETSP0112_2-20121227/8497_1 /TAXON_ID=91324 /ORGANISM="Lotharella globosa, Strain CCCM811" /LENGTH=43 /DNA_ID= /DNA_START= /DNA_END= /DNA_ORIENTATION=